MFSQELENLIDAALADGVLEEREKAAIVRRAQNEGVDLVELEIYLNSILQKNFQAQQADIEKRASERDKERKGNICPHCGMSIPPLTKICPNCGVAIGGHETEGEKELFRFVDELTLAHSKVKSCPIKEFDANKAELERLLQKAKAFYGDNNKVMLLVEDIESQMKTMEKQSRSAKRNDSRKDFFKNPWTWGALSIIITLMVVVYFVYLILWVDYEAGFICLGTIGLGLIIATVVIIHKFCRKKN